MTSKLAGNLFIWPFLLLALQCGGGTAEAAAATSQKAVLVTGASSGIGRNIAERLASEGYFVYAGARKDSHIAELSEIENIQGIRLDVTVPADIEAAVETIKSGEHGLYGIVNNAGVVVMGILAETPESELDFVFDVNVYGPYRITRAFTPMIIESKGRIANISSMAGITSSEAYGVYSMSKHAVEAFSDSLALEMQSVGVRVSVIEPGPFKSNAVASSCKRLNNQGADPATSLFGELAAELANLCTGDGDNPFPEPDAVADAVLHALFADAPRNRYLAITDPQHADIVARDLIRNVVEVNGGHPFSISRNELVAILDEMLSGSDED